MTWDRPCTTVRSRGGSIEDAASFHEEEGGSQPTPPLQTETGVRPAGLPPASGLRAAVAGDPDAIAPAAE